MFVIMGIACALASEPSAMLAGRVVDEHEQPVAGAIVVVNTARPRGGLATKCLSCYSDCEKRTRTDEAGRFTFDGLSNSLTFRLAAGGSGYRGTISEYFDPVEHPKLRLVIRKLSTKPGNERVKGQVVDAKGEPIVGAVVRSRHVHLTNGVTTVRTDSVTPLILTDVNGNFEASIAERVSGVTFRITSPRTAPSQITLSRSTERLKAELKQGASIRGRLLFDGQPLVGAMVGIVQSDRTIRSIVTPFEISTDADGFFQFDQLRVDVDYAIYTQLNQNTPGALPVSYIQAPGSGKRADLGEIATQPAYKLKITVQTANGEPLGPRSRVYVGRNRAWHTRWLALAGESQIASVFMSGLGKERFEIFTRVTGYKIQRTIPPLQPDINLRYQLDIEGDTELTIIVEPK